MTKISSSLIALAAALFAAPVMAQSTDLKVVDQLKIGGDGRWDYITIDQTSQTLYIAHETAISAYDLKAGRATPHLADAQGAHIALPIHHGKDLLVTHGKANIVTVNDATTGAVKTTLKTDVKPDAAVYEPITGKVFIMANGGNAVDAFDPETNALAGRVDVGGAAEAAAIDGQGLVFTHLEDKNAFVVIDARTLTVKATHEMTDCEEPSGIAYIPDGGLILSACQNGIARISNADTGAEVATVKVGARPDAALYDTKARLGYIPGYDGTLTVISFDGTPHVVGTVQTKVGAKTAGIDTDSGRIYLPTADFGPNDAKTGKPTVVSNSFEVIVVGR